MDNKQILEKAVQKAINGGWRHGSQDRYLKSNPDQKFVVEVPRVEGILGSDYRTYIYSHDFAKALWGAHKLVGVQMTDAEYVYQWQYHLQQMVLAEDPIKYLGENI